MVADFGDDIGMAKHHECRVGIGAARKPARVAGLLAAADLEREVAQGVGGQQRLVDRGFVDLGDALLALADHRGPAVFLESRHRRREVSDAPRKRG